MSMALARTIQPETVLQACRHLSCVLYPPPSASMCSTSGQEAQQEDDSQPQLNLDRLLRRSHAAEVAAQAFLQGQRLVSRGHKTDLEFFQSEEQQALDQAKDLLPRFRARPSLLQGLLRVGGLAAGAAAGLAPRPVQLAIWGAVGEVLEEQHTDALRDVIEASHEHTIDPDKVAELREALRRLRDTERVPEGVTPAPDITTLQSMDKVKQIGVTGVAALAVKVAGKAALEAAARL